MSKPRVFISYRRADEPYAAIALMGLLREFLPNDHIFLDVESIEPGTQFPSRLSTAIEGSDIVFVIVGPGWDGGATAHYVSRLFDPTDFVAGELKCAFDGAKRIIPLFFRDATFAGQQIPPSLNDIRFINGVSIRSERFRQDIENLMLDCGVCNIADLAARPRHATDLSKLQDKYIQKFIDGAKKVAGSIATAASGAVIYDHLSRRGKSVATKNVDNLVLTAPINAEPYFATDLPSRLRRHGRVPFAAVWETAKGTKVFACCSGSLLCRVRSDYGWAEDYATLSIERDWYLHFNGFTPCVAVDGFTCASGQHIGFTTGNMVLSLWKGDACVDISDKLPGHHM